MTTEPAPPPLTPAERRGLWIGIAAWSAMLVGPALLFGWREKIELEQAEREMMRKPENGL